MALRAEWGSVAGKIFDYFESHSGRTVSDVARDLALPIPTAYTCTSRLVERGRLRRTNEKNPRRYEACPRVIEAAPRAHPEIRARPPHPKRTDPKRGVIRDDKIADRLLRFFESHPRATTRDAIEELGLLASTAYSSVARLLEYGLISRTGEPRCSRYAVNAVLRPAPELPALGRPSCWSDSTPLVRPTGTLFERVGKAEVLSISGQRRAVAAGDQVDGRESNGGRCVPSAGHPWEKLRIGRER